ncbi:MAG: hypothetical protein C0483_20845 [Pirellula sp.]|nr:hypothetical protein [Pirellula sp.]
MNIVCIVVDRLHWGYLGCYGNTWVATPALDRLASEGFVFAQALAESTNLVETYDCYWRGLSVLQSRLQAPQAPAPTLIERARTSGRRTILVTDEPLVAEHPAGAAFDDTVELDAPPSECPPAADAGATFAARILTEAIDRATADAAPFFLWVHTRGLGGPWDAPPEYRNRYAEEDDPLPPDFTAVPHEELAGDADLDQRFGIAQAYAGQVTLLDACLGGLLEHLEEADLAQNTAVVLLAPRGIALGEHGAVGMFDERLYGELVQTPCIVRLPDGRGRLRRSQALVQASDWYFTLAELCETSSDSASNAAPHADAARTPLPRSVLPLIDDPRAVWRDRAVVIGPVVEVGAFSELGIRTPAWYLRCHALPQPVPQREDDVDDDAPPDELFAKPDDAWEANDVADRCGEVVESLRQTAVDWQAAVIAGTAAEPLHDGIATGPI